MQAAFVVNSSNPLQWGPEVWIADPHLALSVVSEPVILECIGLSVLLLKMGFVWLEANHL